MTRLKSRINRIRRPYLLALAFLAAAFAVHAAWAELTGPSKSDPLVTKAVTILLEREHLSKQPLNDEMSERCLKTFLKMLDPRKEYFNQFDVDAFMKRRNELDDLVSKGDIGFAYTVFNTFLARVDERLKIIDEMLAASHDFTVNEDIVTDGDAAVYAKNLAEAKEIWRKRIKFDLLVQKLNKKTPAEALEKLTLRYHSFAKRMHQIDANELLEMYLTSMTTGYDPHTTYMSANTLENFEITMRLELDGIGAALAPTDGFTVVAKIIPGGAADKDGRLKVKDKVIGVGQGPDGEIEDVQDIKLSEVVDRIRGKRDTVVRLNVLPAAGGEARIYNITRARIELKDSEARSEIVEVGSKANGKPFRVGVVLLPSFYVDMEGSRKRLPEFKSTTRDVKRILEDFQTKQIDSVVLDLRDNGGGSLPESISLTGLFIDEGPIVQVRGADGDVRNYPDPERGTSWDGPLVVLINKHSASASEIFAGAIQDYGRGLIVGDSSTHGKGTVQSLLDLNRDFLRLPPSNKLGALKLTMQQFYRPNGDSTQNRGVLSDVVLPSRSSFDLGESDLDYALKFDRVDPLTYKRVNMVDRTVLDQLRRLSATRCTENPEFQKVAKDIDRDKEQKRRKTITLNEEKFMAEQGSDRKDDDENKIEEDRVIKRDYYFNEALAVTLDYLQLMTVAKR